MIGRGIGVWVWCEGDLLLVRGTVPTPLQVWQHVKGVCGTICMRALFQQMWFGLCMRKARACLGVLAGVGVWAYLALASVLPWAPVRVRPFRF